MKDYSNEYNEFYKFSREEILSILEDECKLFEKILEIKPKFLISTKRLLDFIIMSFFIKCARAYQM